MSYHLFFQIFLSSIHIIDKIYLLLIYGFFNNFYHFLNIFKVFRNISLQIFYMLHRHYFWQDFIICANFILFLIPFFLIITSYIILFCSLFLHDMSFPVHMASNFLIDTLKIIFLDILFWLFLLYLFYSIHSSFQQSSMCGFILQQRSGLFTEGVGRAQRAPAPHCPSLTSTCKLECREPLPV